MSSAINVTFAGQSFTLDASGALWWPARRMLTVSDLHFEKSTYLAQHGSMIAPYDTLDILTRLEALVARYQPQELVLLGDSFHDRYAWHRLDATLKDRLNALMAQVSHCLWIEGNHDVSLTIPGLTFHPDYHAEGICFTHEPQDATAQIFGHYHPKTRLSVNGQRLQGRCFVKTPSFLMMPAFGTYTGGLDIHHEAIATLIGLAQAEIYMLYRQSIYAVPGNKVRPPSIS